MSNKFVKRRAQATQMLSPVDNRLIIAYSNKRHRPPDAVTAESLKPKNGLLPYQAHLLPLNQSIHRRRGEMSKSMAEGAGAKDFEARPTGGEQQGGNIEDAVKTATHADIGNQRLDRRMVNSMSPSPVEHTELPSTVDQSSRKRQRRRNQTYHFSVGQYPERKNVMNL